MKVSQGGHGFESVGPQANQFVGEVADFLLATNDKRLDLSGASPRIEDVCGASADFCFFMAALAEKNIEARDWRKHVSEYRRRA